jgi:hypothetical protein
VLLEEEGGVSAGVYAARYGSIIQVLGPPGDFTITPGGASQSDKIQSTRLILRASIIWYLQAISQPNSQRVFASMFAGARSAGGATSFSPANNSRVALPVEMGAIAPGTDIENTLNWTGAGTLALNGAKLLILYTL